MRGLSGAMFKGDAYDFSLKRITARDLRLDEFGRSYRNAQSDQDLQVEGEDFRSSTISFQSERTGDGDSG